MTINNPGNRVPPLANGTGAGNVSRTDSGAALVKRNDSASPDRILVNAGTSRVQSALNGISDVRAARVSRLADEYANGRYAVDSAKVAQSLIGGAVSPDN
jgi:anti-sigma28 factor (negative regulator of flagellin synthesis)